MSCLACLTGAAAGPTFGGCIGFYRAHPADHLSGMGIVFRHTENRVEQISGSMFEPGRGFDVLDVSGCLGAVC